MAATGATPRKFAEKIAMHNQKGAEEEAEFRKIMAECASVKGPGQPPGPGPTMPTPMQQVRVRFDEFFKIIFLFFWNVLSRVLLLEKFDTFLGYNRIISRRSK